MQKKLPVAVAFAVFTASICLAQSPVITKYQQVTVAEGIYAFLSYESMTPVVQGNTTAIVGDDGVIVVDSGQFPSQARRVIADIKKLTDKPVRVLVNTHWHGDHNLANYEYKREWPNIEIVSHEYTRKAMTKYMTESVEKFPSQLPDYIKQVREALARGTRKDGTPYTDEQKRYLQAELVDLEGAIPEVKEWKMALPNLTITSEARYYLGKREVRLLHLGRSNTAGDVMVHVPDAKVLITGDVVVAPTPYSFGSYLGDWMGVFDKIIAMDTVAIVPGHGAIMRDKSYIETLKKLLDSTRTQVQTAVKQGLTLEDTRKKVDISQFKKQLAGDDYFKQRAFDDFYAEPAVAQAYKEAKGEKWEE